MESTQYIIVNKTTNVVLFKGDLEAFMTFAKAMSLWMPAEEFIQNWAATMNCEVYKKV